ncbi:hypothetical protein QQG55_26590 [Brugia pahangi]
MYWSMLQQLIIIIIVIAISHITNTFACFSNGFCSCQPRIPVNTCPCVPRIPLQQKSYATPYVSQQLPSLLIPPPPSYSAPYATYSINTASFSNVHPQSYNQPRYTYNAPQSLPQQPMILSLPQQPVIPTYNNQPSIGTIIGKSKFYTSPYHIPEIQSQEMSPNAVAEVPTIYESQKSNIYGDNLRQIEVSPSIIRSELIDDFNQQTTEQPLLQYTDDITDATLAAQNVGIISSNQQHSIMAANLNSQQAQMTAINNTTNNNIGINERENINKLQRDTSIKQNIGIIIRPLGISRKRHQQNRLLPCSKIINKLKNDDNKTTIINEAQSAIECIALFKTVNSSKFNKNDELKSVKKNNATLPIFGLNNKNYNREVNLNMEKGNISNVRNGIWIIPRKESMKYFKLFNATSLINDQHRYDSKKLLQKQQNSKNDENMSQNGDENKSNGIKRYTNRNMKTIFKEISSNDWTRRNDILFERKFERTKGLNNEKKWSDYENNFYTTYHHQSCRGQILGHLRNGTIMSIAKKCEELDCDATNVRLSGDHVLEITFLKNITARFKNYGNYCVSKKSIGEIKSVNVIFGANGLSYARRYDSESFPKDIRYRNYRETNKHERQIMRFMKPIVIDGTVRVL